MRSSRLRVEVSGGLANQIFMYLGGIYTAKRNSQSLELIFSPNKIHSESLQNLNISHKIKIASTFEAVLIKLLRQINKASKMTTWVLRSIGCYFTGEVGYPKDLPTGRKTRFVSAYFQSYLIYRKTLEKNSVFALLGYSPSRWAKDLKEKEIAPNDVVIHVRLGDYIDEKDNIGLVGTEYYEQSITKARELGGTGKIRVITNDIVECKKFLSPVNLELDYIEQPKEARDLDSLFILTQHRYLIISNSSFSLLAGFEADSSVVFRPTPWFKNLNEPNKLSPSEWIEIPSAWR